MKPRLEIALLATVLLASACSRRPAGTPVPRPPSPMELAEDHFDSGRYDEAAQQYERYVNQSPGAPDRDRAMFRAGLSRALSGPESWPTARSLFERLVADYPRSPYAVEAGFVLRLRAELDSASAALADRDAQVKKLRSELERLKRIDLERPRMKPPE